MRNIENIQKVFPTYIILYIWWGFNINISNVVHEQLFALEAVSINLARPKVSQ